MTFKYSFNIQYSLILENQYNGRTKWLQIHFASLLEKCALWVVTSKHFNFIQIKNVH